MLFWQVLMEQRILLTFFSIPVSPGNSRLIWSYPSFFGGWIDKIIPKWIFHIGMDLLVQDSDLSILHVEVIPLYLYICSSWKIIFLLRMPIWKGRKEYSKVQYV